MQQLKYCILHKLFHTARLTMAAEGNKDYIHVYHIYIALVVQLGAYAHIGYAWT